MHDSYLSFYLHANRIRVFVKVLRGIGSPNRICFMISDDGQKLMIAPHESRDFTSHHVPSSTYSGVGGFDVNSQKLCRIIAAKQHWDINKSYRVPGTLVSEKNVAIFSLGEASVIERESANGQKEE